MARVKNLTIKSSQFSPIEDFLFVKPKLLDKGELVQDGLVLQMEQNTSVVDRPTFGKVLSIGPDAEKSYLGKDIIWVEQDGIDIEFKDGEFLVLQQKSVLGTIKADE